MRIFAAHCGILLAALAAAQPAQPAQPGKPPAEQTPEADAARTTLRSMLDAWAGAANIEIADGAFDRWYDTLDPGLERQLQDLDSIEPDCTIDRPVFDDEWWPEGLAEAGVPRPAELDERVREPWEWAGQMQRLVWQAQQPEPMATDRWPAVMTLVDTYAGAHAAELARLDEQFQLDRDTRFLVEWLLERDELRDADRAAIEAHPQHDELLVAVDEAHARIDARINESCTEVLEPVNTLVYLVPIASATIFANPMPNISSASDLGRYLVGRSRSAVAKGCHADAARDATLALVLTNAYARVPSSLAATISWSAARRVLLAIVEHLSEQGVETDTLREFDIALDQFKPLPPSYAMRGESLMCYGTLDEFYRHVRGRVPRLDALRQSFAELTRMVGFGASRGVQITIMTEFFEALATDFDALAVGSVPDEQHERARRVLDWVATEELEADETAEVVWDRLHVMGILLPATGGVRQGHRDMVFLRHAVATMLGIELYRAEHGTLPQALEDLPEHTRRFVGDLYVDIRDDPPLGYVLKDAHATGFGVGYVLYDFGRDGEDNGGVKHTYMNYRARAHPRRLEGTDYVFNPPGRSLLEDK